MSDKAESLYDRIWAVQAPMEQITALVRPRFVAMYGRWEASAGTAHTASQWSDILVDALRQEAHSLEEMVEMAGFAFSTLEVTLDRGAREAMQDEWAPSVLEGCAQKLTIEALVTPTTANAFFQDLRHHFRDVAHIRGKRVMYPLHAALVGSLRGPCLGISASLLGLTRCQDRLRRWL